MATEHSMKTNARIELPDDEGDDLTITVDGGSVTHTVNANEDVLIKVIHGDPAVTQCHRLTAGQSYIVLGGGTVVFKPPQPTVQCP